MVTDLIAEREYLEIYARRYSDGAGAVSLLSSRQTVDKTTRFTVVSGSPFVQWDQQISGEVGGLSVLATSSNLRCRSIS